MKDHAILGWLHTTHDVLRNSSESEILAECIVSISQLENWQHITDELDQDKRPAARGLLASTNACYPQPVVILSSLQQEQRK